MIQTQLDIQSIAILRVLLSLMQYSEELVALITMLNKTNKVASE